MGKGTLALLSLMFLSVGVCHALVPPNPSLWLNSLTQSQFLNFSVPSGVVLSLGRGMKFLIDARTSTPVPYFINGNYKIHGQTPEYVQYHYYFATQILGVREDLDTFNNNTYFTQKKQFYAGTLQTYIVGQSTVYGLQFYPQDVIAESTLIAPCQLLQRSLPGLSSLAFVATGDQQTTALPSTRSAFAKMNIQLFTVASLLANVTYFPMNPGTTYGYLRMFPQSQDELAFTDIAVFDELPLTLAVVSGVVTVAYQDPNCHVNLKSRERSTPNMVLRDILTNPTHQNEFQQLANKPVRLFVGPEGFNLSLSTPAAVNQYIASKLNRSWTQMPFKNVNLLTSYDSMCSKPASPSGCLSLSSTFGTKAANLGFLARILGRVNQSQSVSSQLGYNVTPIGFGISFGFYIQFMNSAPNAYLKQQLNNYIAAETNGFPDANFTNTQSAVIQNLFYSNSSVPAQILNAISYQIQAVYGPNGNVTVRYLKFRSSSNSEDVAGFDGAGLYDSYKVDLQAEDNPDFSCKRTGGDAKAKMKPATVNCALKGVFASLWNARAVTERNFARIAHNSSVMAIAVVSAYDEDDDITANSVMITRSDSEGAAYTLAVQKGNNLVTNPDPQTIAETDLIALYPQQPPTVTTLQFAQPNASLPPLTRNVLSPKQFDLMVQLSQYMEEQYCNYKRGYSQYPCENVPFVPQKTRGIDMEFKVFNDTEDGIAKVLLKQLREINVTD